MSICEFPTVFEPIVTKPSRYKIAAGGRGRGASWTFARALLLKAAEKKIRVLCTREVQNSIKDSVYRLLCEQIEALGLSDNFTIQADMIKSNCGSDFFFKGLLRNITEVKSIEGIDVCWVAEAEKISEESWRVLIPTIRKDNSEIWIDFNPGLEESATTKRFMTNRPPDSIFVFSTYRDNPWFPDVLRKDMEYDRSVDEQLYQHVWEGVPLADGAGIYTLIKQDMVDKLKGVVHDFVSERRLVSCDPSLGGDACVIGQFKNTKLEKKRRIYINDTMKIAGEIQMDCNELKTKNVSIDCIGIGAGIADRLEELGYKVIRINSAESASQPDRYANVRCEVYGYCREQIINREIEQITDPKVIKHITSVRYDPKAMNSNGFIKLERKEELKKRIGESPDDGDMFVYGIWGSKEVEAEEVASSGVFPWEKRKRIFSGAGGW